MYVQKTIDVNVRSIYRTSCALNVQRILLFSVV